MDVHGRDRLGAAAHRGHRPDVVHVPVGQKHRRGAEPVLVEHLLQAGKDAHAGVHDHTLLTLTDGHYPAVLGEHGGDDAADEHAREGTCLC